MEIKYFKSTWGMTEDSLAGKLRAISEAGYDGVEAGAPEEAGERREFANLLSKYGLLFIGQQWTAGKDLADHKISFERQFRNNLELHPVQVNSHTGRDFFNKSENVALINHCNSIARESGIKLTHETHRGRFSFSVMSTAEFVTDLPELRLTADFSHWCCVSESFLDEQGESMEKIFPRCDHIHARVGHEESPQVTDPKAPEWEYAVAKHLEWWNRIVSIHEARGTEMLPITVEFGPPNYMASLPFSRKPVADLWAINLYMKEMLKQRLVTRAAN